MHISEQHERLGQVIARALRDGVYKKRLIDAPIDVLQEAGIAIPNGLDLVVVENTPFRTYLTLPYVPHPRPMAISEDYFSPNWQNAVLAATPKDVGCCGGSSSIGATWLEEVYDTTDSSSKRKAV